MGGLWFYKDVLGFQVPGYVNGILAIVFLGLATFLAWRDKQVLVRQLREKESSCESKISPRQRKVDLKLELRSRTVYTVNLMGEKAGQPIPEVETLIISITNLEDAVSISEIELLTKQKGQMDVTLKPHSPPFLPAGIGHMQNLIQYYLFPVGGIDRLKEQFPRVVVKTSCGHVERLGSRAFESIPDIQGTEPF